MIFFFLSLPTITKIIKKVLYLSVRVFSTECKQRKKTKLASLRERSTLYKEYGKFVNTRQEAVQFYPISS